MSPLFDDTDDDVTMPRRGEAGPSPSGRSAREYDRAPADREVTLNTGIVLALFFALALLCAVFFGFGYSIGHKSAPVPPVATNDNAVPIGAPVTGSTSTIKPAPGTAAVPEYVPSGAGATPPPRTAAEPLSSVTQRQAAGTDTVPAAAGRPAPVVRTPPPSTEATTLPATSPAGTTYVQVAAVSHPEDADVLLSALRRRGYTVLTRTDAIDRLIHVQIGPFSTRKDAEAMRQKLLGDGYNAILK